MEYIFSVSMDMHKIIRQNQKNKINVYNKIQIHDLATDLMVNDDIVVSTNGTWVPTYFASPLT